jgi:DNA-binding transcriptional MerR regulator
VRPAPRPSGPPRAEWSSGELAAAAGTSKDLLRFYERRGLLPRARRAANGYRRYPASALGRVRLIRVAVRVGFSVDELAAILRVRDAGGAPCRDVRRIAGEKLLALERKIGELTRLHGDLRGVIADWDRRLTATGPGRRAGLLEALVDRQETAADCSDRPPLEGGEYGRRRRG